LNETQTLAKAAEAEHAALSVFDDQYDLATALITIAMSMLAVCVVVKLPWLYWVSLVPALGGLFWGVAAMAQWPIRADVFFAWLI
jgi:predicted NBD/HSP70 family sugar kinase